MDMEMTLGKKQSRPIDKRVGSKIREARILRGLSQTDLGNALVPAITFQQIQKYEHGTNRVSAGRLWDLAKVLNVDLMYFFGEASEPDGSRPHTSSDAEYPSFSADELELVRIYRRVRNTKVKGQVRALVRALATEAEGV